VVRYAQGVWPAEDTLQPMDAVAADQDLLSAPRLCPQGITSMDQADIYGGYTAEGLLGGALRSSPGLRDRIEIVTKCGIVAPAGRHSAAQVKHYDTSAADINSSVEASLRDMSTDRIDLLLIHRPDPLIDPWETGSGLDGLVASGKVWAVGVAVTRRS
jgi:predicted oxidoreductase